MKMMIKIALRNVFRQRRRSFVTVGTVAVGVTGILFYLAVMNGMLKEMIDTALGLRLPSVSVEKSFEGRYEPFSLPPEAIKKIEGIDGVSGVTPRLMREALITTADYSVEGGSRGVRVYGIDPASESALLDVEHFMHDGSGKWLSDVGDGEELPSVVIGDALAKRMNVEAGGHIIMTVIKSVAEDDARSNGGRSGNVSDTRMLLRVVGIFRASDTGFEKRNVFVKRSLLRAQFPDLTEGAMHVLAIATKRGEEERIAQEVSRIVGGDHLDVFTWKRKDPFLASNLEVFDAMNYIFLFIVLLASSFVLINTMLMVVQERFREFGIVKALGASGRDAALLILMEGAVLGLIGIGAGIVVSTPIVLLFYFFGLNLSFFADGLRSVGIPVTLSPFWHFSDLVITGTAMLLFSFFGSLFPAIKAARIKILNAINFQ